MLEFVNPPVYLAFSHLEGWKEAFEECFMWTPILLVQFLKKLEDFQLLDKFTNEFGQDRLQNLRNFELAEF
ncbi:MAG: hypothetical protein H0T62_05960 [Parachlamydiaceae bacterium]|nr:hypothetical protein [Parachlamydiaceae bacterium]